MALNLISHPTKAFTEAFDSPKLVNAAIVILLTAALTGIAGFVFFGNVLSSAFLFGSSILQWLILTLIVWFFSFAHKSKKRASGVSSFSKTASVTGKLWLLNLASAILTLVMALVLPYAGEALLLIVFVIMAILMAVLFIGWIIASIKMLKVVTGASRGGLVINWIIMIVLYGVILSALYILIFWAVPL